MTALVATGHDVDPPLPVLRVDAPPGMWTYPIGFAFAPDGTLGVVDGSTLWQCPVPPAGGDPPAAWRRLELPVAGVTALAWSDAGDRLALGTSAGQVALLRASGRDGVLTTRDILWSERMYDQAVRFVSFVAGDCWIAHAGCTGAVSTSDAETGQRMRCWTGQPG